MLTLARQRQRPGRPSLPTRSATEQRAIMNNRQQQSKPGTPLRRSLKALGTGVAVCLVSLAPCIFSAQEAAAEPIRPVPTEVEVDRAKAELGKWLFHDTRLSKNNTISCASCHDLSAGGDDGRVVSIGMEGRSGVLNAPTVFNAGFNFKQFWDGRAHTLTDQIDGPLQSSVEMESIWPDVVTKLFQDTDYPGLFQQIYPDSEQGQTISRQNIKDAIAEFVRSLTTPHSRFDRWLKGDTTALNDAEKEGYALFKRYGCASCHQGANVGGNMFQVFGVINDYFTKRGNITDADLGRFNVTGNEADRHAFKVPSLRMAAHTAPYLHDGSAATLRDAVDAMFEFQLGREAPDAHKDAIVTFLKTLPGEYVDTNYQFDLEQSLALAVAQDSPGQDSPGKDSPGQGEARSVDSQPKPVAPTPRRSRFQKGAARVR